MSTLRAYLGVAGLNNAKASEMRGYVAALQAILPPEEEPMVEENAS